jgi:N-dimethylarginine dimethylaminohydrolase
MKPTQWKDAYFDQAMTQWDALYENLQKVAKVHVIEYDDESVPDICFVANAAVVRKGVALMARFATPERKKEEPLYNNSFCKMAAKGIISEVIDLPSEVVLEGAGDCLWDRHRKLFWVGHGQRSDAFANETVENILDENTVELELADKKFYHLDTAMAPLSKGHVIWFPGAFTEAAKSAIKKRVGANKQITLSSEDAKAFGANAISVDDTILISTISATLQSSLRSAGYNVIMHDTSIFQKSGGSCACLVLRLDH